MSTDPVDLDAIERMAAGSHDPVMALQTRALVAEVRRLRGELERYDRQLTLGAPSTVLGHEGQPAGVVDAIHRQIAQARREVAAAALRWAAERTNCMDDSETLRSMADHIVAGQLEMPGQESRDDREPPYHFGEMEPR